MTRSLLARRTSLLHLLVAAASLASATLSSAQPAHRKPAVNASEQRAARAFEAARKNPLELHAFLERMPKGADLHMHLSGAIYAETFLREAAADNLCVNPKTLSLTPSVGTPPTCLDPDLPVARAFTDQHLYDALVDSFSMRSFVPSTGTSGHDQFFATFDRFGGLKSHSGEWLDEVATRAAAQNEQYLEVMMTPSFSHAAKLGYELGWPVESGGTPATATQLAALRGQLLAKGLRDEVATDIKQVESALAERNTREHCGQPDAAPACSVTIRILYQVLRAFPPQQVFAQTLLGFEAAAADPNIVGINFVQPEDAYMAMSEYHRQMLMLDYLHNVYPGVHISLHAGELAPGLVPPEGLRFHIREAVELGHAERIGHGVDVMYEDRPKDLLKEMADKHVMVEINLTSNDVILGVSTNHHSLPAYRAANVPVALSTDDEGVSRINLTHEYARAALDFDLSYQDLKQMARTGLEHSFLPGPSLWATPDVFSSPTRVCALPSPLGAEQPTPACQAFLKSSEKAAQQWELEHRFATFEGSLP